MYCISPCIPFLSQASSRGASCSKNSAFDIPQNIKPSLFASRLIKALYTGLFCIIFAKITQNETLDSSNYINDLTKMKIFFSNIVSAKKMVQILLYPGNYRQCYASTNPLFAATCNRCACFR